MKQVTQQEFYSFIGPLNVTLTVLEPFPYTTEFKLHNRDIKGKVIESWSDGVPNKRPIQAKYFIYP